jgi:ankyrin repeat protein
MNSLDKVKSKYGKVFTLADLYTLALNERTDILDEYQKSNLNLVLASGDDSLLAVAAFNGSIACLQYLLDVGVDLDYQANDGVTAIMNCVYASWSNNVAEVVQRLVLAGANLNLVEKHGLNVIQLAYVRRHTAILKTFMNLGINITDVMILGLSPIEYILTKVTDTSMDDLFTILIENSIDSLFARIPRLLHFLSRKSTPYLEQLLRKNLSPSNNTSLATSRIDDDTPEPPNTSTQDEDDVDLIVDFNIDFNSEWIFTPDDFVFPSSPIQSIINNSNRNIVLEMDANGWTPLHHAVDANLLDNAELLIEYGRIDLNVPMYLALFDKIISKNMLRMMILFIEHGIKFDPKRQWIHWYFSNYVNSSNNAVIDLILNHTLDLAPIIDLSIIRKDLNKCNCTIFNKAVSMIYPRIVERILINSNSHTYNFDHICKSSDCRYYQYTVIQDFVSRLASGVLNNYPQKDVFRMFHLLLRFNLTRDINFTNYDWSYLNNENIASLLEHFGLVDFGQMLDNKPLNGSNRAIRKWLVCHSKTMKYTARNTEEYGTFEPIVDIPSEDFVLLHNDIVWSMDSLYQYLFSTVNGVNVYDDSSPWKGQNILTPNDLSRLHSTLHPIASKIYNYMSVSNHLKILPVSLLDKFAYIGSIFSARGEHFEKELEKILLPEEAVEWAEVRNFESTNAMPKLSHELLTKIMKLKQETMAMLFSIYTNMTSEQKNCLESLNVELSEENFIKLFKGEYCTMTMGSYLTKVVKALTQWK